MNLRTADKGQINVTLMINKQNIGMECDYDTKLFPETVVSNERIAGFAMLKYFKNHTLEGKKTSSKC